MGITVAVLKNNSIFTLDNHTNRLANSSDLFQAEIIGMVLPPFCNSRLYIHIPGVCCSLPLQRHLNWPALKIDSRIVILQDKFPTLILAKQFRIITQLVV